MIDWKFGYFNYKDKTASIKIIITYWKLIPYKNIC
jgi:hypothetical protein